MANRREQEKKQQRMVNARDWAKDQKTSWESTSVKLAEGVEWYKLEPGVHLLDFMPYVVGVGNPRADEGMLHFEREYTAHRIPMPNGKTSSFCCLWDTFKKKCPICEFVNMQGRNADPDLIRQLRGTTRHLWLVNDKPGDSDNALKVLDTNHYNKKRGFGEQMVAIINSDEDYANFANLEGGFTVKLTVEEDTFPGGKYNVVTRIDFKSRKYNYDEDILERCPCLDEMIIETPYKELKALLEGPAGEGKEEDDQEESEKPHTPVNRVAASTNGSTGKKTKPDPDPDDDDSEIDDEGDDVPKSKGFKVGDKVLFKGELYKITSIKNPMKVVIEDADDETETVSMGQLTAAPTKEKQVPSKPAKKAPPVVEDDDELDDGDSDIEPEDDEDDTPPVIKAGKKKAVEPDDDDEENEDDELEDEDEPEDSDDSDEEDEPAPKKRGRPATKK